MSRVKALPRRSQVKKEDQWDLASLFKGDQQWEESFKQWERMIGGYEKYKGRLAESAGTLAELLRFDAEVERVGEKLGNYAFLKTCEDQANSDYQRMKGRFQHVATRAAEAASYIRPEIMEVEPGL